MGRLTRSDAQLNATAEARSHRDGLVKRTLKEGWLFAKEGLLGAGVDIPVGRRAKAKGRKRRGEQRSAAPPPTTPTTSNDPTPERAAKAPFGTRAETHPGGQVSHWVRPAIDYYAKHFAEQEIADVARRLPGYKLINMFHGGKTPLLPAARLETLGYHVVIIPSDTKRAAIKAMQRVLATIARDGSAAAMIDDMASFKERETVVDTAGYLARDKRYGA